MSKTLKTRDMILISLFAALTAVGAFIKVPTPTVPFTLQFLFCTYAGLFLGAKHGLYSQLLYLCIGLIGIPIFTSGGGPAYLFQPTFGYLIGFAFCSYVVGKSVDLSKEIKFRNILAAILLGLTLVYVFGIIHLYLILNFYLAKEVSFMQTLWIGFLPYITFDVLQSIFIAITALKIIPILRNAGYLAVHKK